MAKQNREKRFTFRLSVEDAKKFEELCARSGESLSVTLRRLIREAFEREKSSTETAT